MAGRHGKQLALAHDEGLRRDQEEFDFFPEEEEEHGYDSEEEEEDDKDEQGDMEEEEEEDDNTATTTTTDDVLEEEEEEPLYNNDGSPIRSQSDIIAYRAGAPAGGSLAIIQLEGFQHKVAVNDVIITNKLLPVEHYRVGTTHTLRDEQVLLVADAHQTFVGLPSVHGGAEVDVMVEEITHDKTVVVFKKRRRKHSRRKNGFRREVTFLRVLDIRMPPTSTDDNSEASTVDSAT